ncbi:MAG: membrane protein insertase YidC, partial [Proteobacteria bacterium]|nr:membrane protein insertase YidC [Pseudomonadota bacterium]
MDNTRLFLFAALVFVGVLMWQQWQIDYGPQSAAPVEIRGEPGQPQLAEDILQYEDLPEQADGVRGTGEAPSEPAAVLATEEQVLVETDVIRAIIDTRGGVIRSLKLKKYPVSLEQPDEGLELIHSDINSLHIIQSGLRNRTDTAPTHHSIYRVKKNEYRLADHADELSVPLFWMQDGIEVTKTYLFRRGDYLIDVSHRVVNNSDTDWQGSQYRQIQRARPLSVSRILYTYTGAVYYNDEVKYEKVKFDDMEDERLRVQSTGGWIAMLQHYFLSAWIPAQDDINLAYSIANTGQQPATYTIGLRSENRVIAPGGRYEFTSQLFVGPKIVKRLEEIAPGLDLTVDYGVLTFLSKPLYWLLSFYSKYVGNWGL